MIRYIIYFREPFTHTFPIEALDCDSIVSNVVIADYSDRHIEFQFNEPNYTIIERDHQIFIRIADNTTITIPKTSIQFFIKKEEK